jgi:hypothetical protein
MIGVQLLWKKSNVVRNPRLGRFLRTELLADMIVRSSSCSQKVNKMHGSHVPPQLELEKAFLR